LEFNEKRKAGKVDEELRIILKCILGKQIFVFGQG
jgi:hypothetical protein